MTTDGETSLDTDQRRRAELLLTARRDRAAGSGTPTGRAAGNEADGHGSPERDGTGVRPLTSAERRMWFLHEMDPTSPAYHLGTAARLHGELDVIALRAAVDAVVARHEMLRSTFCPDEHGEPVRHVAATLAVEVSETDLTAEAQPDVAARALLDDFAREPYDLRTGPLLRVALAHLGTDDHVLILALHHIVADGWSLGVLHRDLREAYADALAGHEVPHAVPEADLDDRAARECTQAADADRAFWRRALNGAAPVELPMTAPRPPVARFVGAAVDLEFDEELVVALETLARNRRASLYVVLATGFGILLHCYSGQEQITIGTPVANRDDPAWSDMVALFVNTLVICADLNGNSRIDETLDRVRDNVLEALEHQSAPFETVVDDLTPARSLSHNPIVQVMFALQNARDTDLELPGLAAEQLAPSVGSVRLDLECSVWRRCNGLRVRMTYNTDLFTEATVRRLGTHYGQVLRAIVADATQRVNDIDMRTPAERTELDRLATAAPPTHTPATLHSAVAAQATATPDAVAVAAADHTLTYADLDRAAARLTVHLAGLGVARGDVVGVCLPRTSDLVVGLLGVLGAGAVALPLDPADPQARRDLLLADGDAVQVLVERDGPAPVSSTPTTTLPHDTAAVPETPLQAGGPDDLAYLVYTSGTTGRPKGVAVAHRQVTNTLAATTEHFAPGADDVGLVLARSTFDVFFYELFGPLLVGGCSRIVAQNELLDPKTISGLVGAATSFQAVPGVMEHVLTAMTQCGQDTAPRMRTVVTGGDRVPPEMLDRLRERFPAAHVAVTYGPTETAIFATVYDVSGPTRGYPLGVPLPGVEVRVIGPTHNELPVEVAGEIWIGGRGVTSGYVGRPEETTARFVTVGGRPGYRTGDRGRLRADGTLEFLDRADDQVKIRGHRIELGEVETVLAEAPGVRHAVALVEGEVGSAGRRLVAHVTPDADPPDLGTDGGTGNGHRNSAEGGLAMVEGWRELFNQTHWHDPGRERDYTGWNSSYDGTPLSVEDMHEWVDGTLARLRDKLTRPARASAPCVLEIGCGTGLITAGLAPYARRYVATDFSTEVLANLRRRCADRAELDHVELVHAAAHELPDLDELVDVVVLNSVVQYMPDADYLRRVLNDVAGLLAPDGFIFVGDVRHFGLLELFATGVQAARTPELPAAERRERVADRIDNDDELLVHPDFFSVWLDEVGFAGMEAEPRRGHQDNELTRYRYDATLWVGPQVGHSTVPWVGWNALGGSLDDLAAVLTAAAPDGLAGPEEFAVTGVPHALLRTDIGLRDTADRTNDPPGGEGAVTPEAVHELANWHGWEATCSWAGGDDRDGRFRVFCWRRGTEPSWRRLPPQPDHSRATVTVNSPERRAARRRLAASTRQFAANHLPDYMVPDAVAVLADLPQTENGKVDRTRLGSVPRSAVGERHREPVTPTEQQIAEVWRHVLEVDRVSAVDDFFEVGGTSLLAIQVTMRMRGRGLAIAPHELFELRTVEHIAAHLDTASGQPPPDPAPAPQPARTWPANTAPSLATASEPTGDSGYLLTGATGMLGVHLLRQLRQDAPKLPLTCLVRAPDDHAAARRLVEQYRWYFPDDPDPDAFEQAIGGSVRVVAADLTQDHGGCRAGTWRQLAGDVSRVVHAAADVRHVAHRAEIDALNVDGTSRLLDLAASGDAEFVHLSSIAVAGRMDAPDGPDVLGEDDLDIGQRPTEAYSASKIESERRVRGFAANGGQAAVFRVGTVAPHSISGRFQRNIDGHFFSRFIRAVVELGLATTWPGRRFALVPADVMALFVLRLADARTDALETYHLHTPHTVDHNDVVRMLQNSGYAIRIVDPDEFAATVYDLADDPVLADAAGRMLPLLTERTGHAVTLDDRRTAEQLTALGLRYPRPTTTWLQRFFAHAVDVGHLPAPRHAGSQILTDSAGTA